MQRPCRSKYTRCGEQYSLHIRRGNTLRGVLALVPALASVFKRNTEGYFYTHYMLGLPLVRSESPVWVCIYKGTSQKFSQLKLTLVIVAEELNGKTH